MSLHRILQVFVITLLALALGTGVSLVVLSSELHRAARDLESSLHSVRLVEEMQIDLLTYEGARGDSARVALERDIRDKMQQAQAYVDSPEEGRALDDAERLIGQYISTEPRDGAALVDARFDTTLAALRGVVATNVDQAEASVARSARWDMWGNIIGVGVGGVLVCGTVALLVWLQAVAFRPVFDIRNVMKAFGAGDQTARTAERGPAELRQIGRQFNEMADALARQHDNQAAFLAAVAHDLRNPINALRLSAEVLAMGEATPARVAGLMDVVKRQVASLDRMIGDLLDATRIQSGDLELRVEDCDARGIARDAFDLFRSSTSAHELVLDVPDGPVALRCDRLRLGQVLNNLMSNAIKYSPKGGRVTLNVRATDGGAVFEVSDQGVGISPDDLPYVFEPFRRTRTSRETVPGVGLGLSVAQRIVRAHGGEIRVQSAEGSGSRFTVTVGDGDRGGPPSI